MGKKRRKQASPPERDEAIRSTSEYYRLNTRAVEDLVTADESNSPAVSEEELNKYRGRVRKKLPLWLKVSLVKAWFYGSVCFFFLWGLGGYLADALDLFFVTAIALGMVTDLLINTILRYYAETDGANDRWMMVPRRGVAGFFLNILYAFLVLGLVDLVYNVINLAILSVTHATGTVPLGVVDMIYNLVNIAILSLTHETGTVPMGVGPILFGLFYMGIDTGLIALKHLLGRIVADARAKASQPADHGKGNQK